MTRYCLLLSMEVRIVLSVILIFFRPSSGSTKYNRASSQLTVIPNITATSVRKIYLQSNQITSIPSDALEYATSVWYLNLQENEITTTSEDAFYGIPIARLYLDTNPLAHFPYFPHINNTLTVLGVADCKITNTNWDLVVPYSNLKQLNLAMNVIKEMPDLNQTKSTLESLGLKGCGITELKPYYFRGFEKLKSLNIEANQFTELKDYTFDGLNALIDLKMAFNKFVATEWFAFSGLSSLQGFYASNGLLTTFPCVGPFSPFLAKFGVHTNKIENFPENCTKFANVTEINFSFNNLQGVTINNALRTFTKVDSFNFQKVGKVCLEFDGLNQLKQSTYINLKENNLKYLPEKNCSVNNAEPDDRALDLPRVTELNLYNNELLQVPNISLLVELKRLLLHYNNLTQLPPFVFAGNKNLTDLVISHNKLTKLPPLVFANNKNLQYIDLSSNSLTEAPDLTGGCEKLIKLILNSNNITSLRPNYFNGCLVLKEVYLSHNLLTAMPSFTKIGSSLKILHIKSNRISGVISADMFINLTALYNFDFVGNYITSLDMAFLQHTPLLYNLNLRHNHNLTTIEDPYRWCTGKACKYLQMYVDINSGIRCDESRCWAKRYPAPIKSYFGKCFGKFWKYVTLADLKCPGDVNNFC